MVYSFAAIKKLWNLLGADDIPEVDDTKKDVVDGQEPQPENIAETDSDALCKAVTGSKLDRSAGTVSSKVIMFHPG